MIATEQQHYHNPSKNMNNIFDADWETLSQISRSSRLSERVSLYDDIGKLGDHLEEAAKTRPVSSDFLPETMEREKSSCFSNDWTKILGNNRLDLILTASSLTEGSCFSLHSECDDGDDDILSTAPFDEEAVDSRDRRDSTNTNHDEGTKSALSHEISNCPDKTRKDTEIPSADDVQVFRRGRSISYAQLFFDPETKALVTLMEISNCIQPACRHHKSSRSKHGADARGSSRLERRKNNYRETPLHRSSELLSKSHNENSFCSSTSKRDGDSTEGWELGQDEDQRPFQDETLSTECSSLSSATFRRHDHSHCDDDCGADLGFAATQFYPPSPTRFSDEPIVFSNAHMEQKLCWLDEAYLLQDCDDPWDYDGGNRGGNARCGDSIKKLLSASRLCISLAQLGESKWRASSPSHRTPDLLNRNHNKAKLEQMSYSVLNDI